MRRKICKEKCAMTEPTMSDLLDIVARLWEVLAKEGVDFSVDIKVKPLVKSGGQS